MLPDLGANRSSHLNESTVLANFFKTFLKSGHSPTLFPAFLYFSFSCCIWVLNGAMAPFISKTFNLSPAQKGLMLSIPIIAGALMRFPLGILSQYIGRKNATLVAMGLIAVAMLFGILFVKSFNDLLAMGVLLGIADASFGVALSLGSGSFPPKNQGARRIWSDRQGRIRVAEWLSGNLSMHNPLHTRWRSWKLPEGTPRVGAV